MLRGALMYARLYMYNAISVSKLLNSHLYPIIHVLFSGAARVGLLTFSTEPELQFNLDTYSTNNDVTRAITEIVYTRGTTQTHTALE